MPEGLLNSLFLREKGVFGDFSGKGGWKSEDPNGKMTFPNDGGVWVLSPIWDQGPLLILLALQSVITLNVDFIPFIEPSKIC